MHTIIEDMTAGPDPDKIARGGEILKAGGLVAFPTETVYGLGGNALDATASRRIYEAKGRPSDNPLIVHIADTKDLPPLAKEVPDAAWKLAEAFWPGPMTMIFRSSGMVPPETTGGLDTVAVRLPSNEIARALIRAGGGYVAAPSANASGRPSPTLAAHVIADLEGKIDMVIDGGEVGIGLESSIIDLTEDVPVILRPGFISQEMFARVLDRDVAMDRGLQGTDPSVHPRAPGMKYRHYAPKAPMYLVEGNTDAVCDFINEQIKIEAENGRTAGVLAAAETFSRYRGGVCKCIGARLHPETITRSLYRLLREFDQAGVSVIYSETFDLPQVGPAVMNRLKKAAGGQIIQVTGK